MSRSPSLPAARCAELLRQARTAVALTGAGISTAAGLPDFRGPRGILTLGRYDPEKTFESSWFRRSPEYFYAFSRDFIALVCQLQPTFTHRFLAWLEGAGHLAGVVTQNIDQLHRVAGSRRLVELHGSYGSAGCLACGRRFRDLDPAWWQRAMAASPRAPVALCRECGGVLKPDIVFFGEEVRGLDRAANLVGRCDLLLVIGSSLQVAPASLLPTATAAPTVVVNQGEVTLPAASHRWFVAADLETYFRDVARHLADG